MKMIKVNQGQKEHNDQALVLNDENINDSINPSFAWEKLKKVTWWRGEMVEVGTALLESFINAFFFRKRGYEIVIHRPLVTHISFHFNVM